MSKKFVLVAVLVVLISLAVAGVASAATEATPRGIGISGVVTAIDYGTRYFDVTNNQGTTEYIQWVGTLYFYHPSCVVTQFSELEVGHTVGISYVAYPDGRNSTRAIVVFPTGCP